MPSYSPRCSMPFGSMGGEYIPVARPTMPSEGALQSDCPTSLARPSCRLDPVAIAKWVARASTDEVLKYWDTTASLCKQTLCWEQTPDPPHSSHLSPTMRLLVNECSWAWRAQWVCTHLAMSASPSHPYHHEGGSTGPMAPSPAIQQVSSPSTSTARDCASATHEVFVFSLSTNSEKGGASLAQHQAATILQCWKRCIWLVAGSTSTLSSSRSALSPNTVLWCIGLCQVGQGQLSSTSNLDQQDLQHKDILPSLLHLWPATTTTEEGATTQSTVSLSRLKAPAPCSRFVWVAIVYAFDLLDYTN
jgi:hypothetical protein